MKFLTLLCLVPSFLFSAPIPDEPKYTGEAEKLRMHFDDLFDASKKVNSPKEKATARRKIALAFEWDRIGKECLGRSNWAKALPSNRAEFSSLLKDVITRTAYTRLDKFWDGATPRFEVIDVKGNEAHVLCRFHFQEESFTLDYYLSKQGPKWLIYDLAYEGLKYSANINEQIDAFLKEKNMSELLGKLRKRRDELKG